MGRITTPAKRTCVLVLLSFLVCFVRAFNVETTHYVRHKGQDQSMFGFSVATHKEHGQSWVIVGAPTAQEENTRIHRRGIVYKCRTDSDSPCEEIHFHRNQSERGKTIDDKNNQWFGATVNSAGPNGPILACAPRYVWFTTSREERRDPVGTCYIVKNNFNTFSEYSPCRTSLFGYHRQGSCQAGFSAGISKDGRRLFVGAPGSWYWQGQMYSIDPSVKFPFTPGIFGEAFGFGTKGQVIQQDLDNRPSVTSTPEGPAKNDDSYMGYSMVVGDFDGAGVQGIAVGMPKAGRALEGKVLLYTWNLINYLSFTGNQMGEYFGYSLGTTDIDGDGRDDLIIGAPMHTEKNNDLKYEVGRVYLAYQGRNGSYGNLLYLDGFNTRSRFGLSVAGLGDLNLDGYGDFAVGAPYDGPNERGTVYIYQGSAKGVISHYSQAINAEDVQISFGQYNPLSTFGFSITGGLDLDGNDYPDMAVGAYLSDTAFFFRSRPVVKVEASLNFLSRPKHVYLERKECINPSDPTKRVPCTEIELCLRYTGIGTPSQVVMDLTYTLDTRIKSFSRMYIDRNHDKEIKRTIILQKDAQMNCQYRDTIYFLDEISDKLTELTVEIKYSLHNATGFQYTQRDPRSILEPIVDLSNPAVVNESISIFKNCGINNVCIPNLYLQVDKKVDRYLYQVGNALQFDVLIVNSGQNSYNTQFFTHLPEGVTFKVAYEANDPGMKPYPCYQTYNKTIYVCKVGNPFQKRGSLNLIVEVEPLQKQKILKPTYEFFMNVTSANPGRPESIINTTRHISIDVWVNAILQVEATSTPATIVYNVTQQNTVDKVMADKPLVTHSYIVTNQGPSDVEEVEIFLVWPTKTLDGRDLMYMLEPPHTLGGVKCQEMEVNRLKLPTWQLKNIWSGLDLQNVFKSNTSQEFLVENGTAAQPDLGDTTTQTISSVIYYNTSNAVINSLTVIGEPTSDEYWGNISAIASEFQEPLIIRINSSTIIRKYVDGVKVSEKIVPTTQSEGEEVIQTYQIIPNITTDISYYGPAKNLVYHEITNKQPGSLDIRNLIKDTKNKLNQPITTVVTNTTKQITVKTITDKTLHEEVWIQTGTESETNPEISRTNTITQVTFLGPDDKVLVQEILTVEPSSPMYWEEINKVVSQYRVPIKVRTHTTKVTTYYLNGKIIRQENVPIQQSVVEAPIISNTETTTTITILGSNNKILLQDTITGDDYSEHLNRIINRFKDPLTVKIKTTSIITYKRADGRIIKIETYVQERTETVTPSELETRSYQNVTLIQIYDLYNTLLHEENFTDTDSQSHWDKISKIVSKYDQGVTITKHTETYVTYYINGKVVRTEPSKSLIYPKTSIITNTVVNTDIKIYNARNDLIFQDKMSGKVSEDHIKTLVDRFPEPITLKVITTYTIKYSTLQGVLVQTGIYIHERSETHTPRPQEVKVTSIITTVTILDSRGTIVHQENVTDTPDSNAYWEKVNKIISNYEKETITVEKVTHTIITYYIDNQVVRVETKENPKTPESLLRPDIGIESDIEVFNLNEELIYQQTVQEAINEQLISAIVDRFRESVKVNIKTTYIITYRDINGNVIKIGTYVQQQSKTYNKNPQETHTTTIITTVILTDSFGNTVHQENVTETPGSKKYWEKITQFISTYRQPVTVHIKTQTIITYYFNGYVTRTELVDGSDTSETVLSTEIDISTLITVQNSKKDTIHRDSFNRPATQEDIDRIIARFSEPIEITTETTYTIKYKNSRGQIERTGTYIERRTEKHSRPTNQTTSTAIVTTIIFYDHNRNVLHQEEINDEPNSQTYWDKINAVISRYRETITVYITTETIKTFYINNQPIRSERIPSGIQPNTYTTRIKTTTSVAVYDSQGRYLYQEDIAGEKGTSVYNAKVNEILQRYRESLVFKTKTTYTITYHNLDGRIMHVGTIVKETTDNHNNTPAETTRTSVVTVITYYGPNKQVVDRENIREEPGSVGYWEHVKNFVLKQSIPITIQTNITNIITYYLNGREVRTEHIAGNAGIYETPFSANVAVKSVVTYYDENKNEIYHEDLDRELSARERQERIAAFSQRYASTFSLETNTTKTVTFRSFNGQILHADTIPTLQPTNPIGKFSRTVTKTTFNVYGTDGTSLLYTETIQGEPGSAAYNDAITKIVHRYPGPVTIYTNSTKIITYYTREGTFLDEETRSEPRSSVQKDNGGNVPANARTTITFYAPDGQALHTDTIMGAPGPNLKTQLEKIAKDYNGLVRSYKTSSYSGEDSRETLNSGGKAYQLGDNHFNDYNYLNSPANHTSYQEIHRSTVHNDDLRHQLNLQDVNQDSSLGSFAKKGSGFRSGGVNLGLDSQARNAFDSYDQQHTYLSGRRVRDYTDDTKNKKNRMKREDKTEDGVETLSTCKTSECLLIRCTTGRIPKGFEVHVAVRARIFIKNLIMPQPVSVQSLLMARVNSFYEISGSPSERKLYHNKASTLISIPQPYKKPNIVQLWVVVLSAVAGTLILLLLIFLLYMCGFFNRNRPSDAPERQPLNRNGHFQHGDEAL